MGGNMGAKTPLFPSVCGWVRGLEAGEAGIGYGFARVFVLWDGKVWVVLVVIGVGGV